MPKFAISWTFGGETVVEADNAIDARDAFYKLDPSDILRKKADDLNDCLDIIDVSDAADDDYDDDDDNDDDDEEEEENAAAPAAFNDIELADGGVIEAPDDNGTIRRRDINGNLEESHAPDDPEYPRLAQYFPGYVLRANCEEEQEEANSYDPETMCGREMDIDVVCELPKAHDGDHVYGKER